jgi:hypothetical protein
MSQLNVDTIKNRLGTAGPVVPSLTVTQYSGSGTTAGNSSDPDRGSSGSGQPFPGSSGSPYAVPGSIVLS